MSTYEDWDPAFQVDPFNPLSDASCQEWLLILQTRRSYCRSIVVCCFEEVVCEKLFWSIDLHGKECEFGNDSRQDPRWVNRLSSTSKRSDNQGPVIRECGDENSQTVVEMVCRPSLKKRDNFLGCKRFSAARFFSRRSWDKCLDPPHGQCFAECCLLLLLFSILLQPSRQSRLQLLVFALYPVSNRISYSLF